MTDEGAKSRSHSIRDLSESGEDSHYELTINLTDEEVEGLVHGSGTTFEFQDSWELGEIHGIYVQNQDTDLDMEWVRSASTHFSTPFRTRVTRLLGRVLGR